MAGSIRQRKDRGENTWELRIFLGRNEAGKVRHRSVLFRGSCRAAERELARLVADQDRQPEPVPAEALHRWGPTTTINDAIEGWRANGWDDLSPTTTRRYLSMWECHIKNSIGTRRIAQLGPYDVETYFRGLKEAGLAQASVRQIRAVLHRACRLARKWSNGSLSNPVAETELPEWTLGESSDAVRSPTADEIRRILAAAQKTDVRLSAFIRLVAATGFRRGEACALRWSDIDLHHSIVRVDSALVAVLGGTNHRGPKTRASVRAVAIDTGTRDVLRTLFDRQQTLATACGVELGDDAYVFATEPGAVVPPHPDSMSHAFARVRGKANVAVDIHLHSLRHFQSTELDRVISEAQKQARLGWSTVQMARHYTDAVPAEDRKAAEHIGTLLDGEPQMPTQPEDAAPSTFLSHPAPACHLPKGAQQRGAAPATGHSV